MKINTEKFVLSLRDSNIGFITGVPDSLLKSLCSYFSKNYRSPSEHLIAVNEGAAIAMAVGSYLATGKIPLVYMQNSGLGNAINPLVSLADKDVYSIPMILLVGWRGEPGQIDEPQHLKQGKITPALFEALGIEYLVIDGLSKDYEEKIRFAVNSALKKMAPFAIIIRQQTFDEYKQQAIETSDYELSREEAITLVYEKFMIDSLFISTTGHISRELYEISEGQGNAVINNVFYTVGSMGFSSQIALGLNLFIRNRKVICIDGDGSLLMHMGGIATIGQFASSSYIHILLNNCSHDSVGGQPTVAGMIDLPTIALSSGYKNVYKSITTRDELISVLANLTADNGPTFIEIMVKKGARADLGRPKQTPIQNKLAFIKQLNE